MAAGLARDVVAIRIGPSPGIAIGRAQEHQDFFARADLAAADLDILRRGAEEGLHRAFEADRFLERIARQRSIPAQSNERTSIGASAAVISPASTRAWMQAPNPPGARLSRWHCSCT